MTVQTTHDYAVAVLAEVRSIDDNESPRSHVDWKIILDFADAAGFDMPDDCGCECATWFSFLDDMTDSASRIAAVTSADDWKGM